MPRLSGLHGLLRAALLCAPALVGGCRLGATVMRVDGGQPVPGRWISPAAYASFLEGSLAEAAGHPDVAAAHYRQALDEDPAAAEAWTRLGAVHCTTDRDASEAAFARARALEPDLAAPWVAAAECALARNDAPRARRDATEALRRSPRDPEITRALVLAMERTGDVASARRLRRGYALFAPAVVADGPGALSFDEEAATPDLDHAFVTGDAHAIARGRVRVRLTLSQVALRAARAGHVALAEQTAQRVLAAEPGNADALVALLVARDLAGSGGDLTLTSLPAARSPLSPLARELMRELLARRAGSEAARAFAEPSTDPIR